MFFRPLRELAEKFNMFQSAMAASERAFTLLDEKIEIKNNSNALLPGKNIIGDIEFKNVSFSYNSREEVLKNISFKIKSGEKVALIGDTGSGKTTIINLLNRTYDIVKGEILIDGKNIKNYSVEYLRENIGVVPQEPFFFNGSVSENLVLFRNNIENSKITEASKRVHLHNAIEKFENKYDENIFQEGKKLSSGQRQLVSFARALIKDAQIIILDEATSNIDSETEKYIEAATREILSDKTSLIIAHRLSTIKMCDRILVLKKGMLTETGDHKTLMKKRGVYYKLYKIQSFLLS